MAVPKSTERLDFRRMTRDDEARIFALFSDAEARRHYPTMGGHVECRRWIDWNLENYERHGYGLWIISERGTGAFLGDCGLSLQDVGDKRQLEVGYHVIAAMRGNGFAAEAARAAMKYGFACTDHDLICSIVSPENLASIRVAARIHRHSRGFHNGQGNMRLCFWTARRDQA